jgi:hypothetical protein
MTDALQAAKSQAFGGSSVRRAAFEQATLASEAAEIVLTHARAEARVPAAVLLRQALVWAVRSASPETPRTPTEAWAVVESIPEATGLAALTDPERSALRRAFVEVDPFDVSGPTLEADLAALRCGIQAILNPSRQELRAVARIRMVRRLRWALLALIPLGIAAAIVTWRTVAAQRDNLAFHKPTSASSHQPSHPTTNGVVDGKTYGIGFHTAHEPRPWLLIDLQAVKRIRQVTAYNSDHCCFERAVPLVIEVSTDGKKYHQVARRDQPFGVWQADLVPTDARYVKLYSDKATFLHLSEVEVR